MALPLCILRLALSLELALAVNCGLFGADVIWTSNTGGDWEEPENWSSAPNLPGVSDAVEIDVAGSTSGVGIVHSAGSTTIDSLTLHEELRVEGGSLVVSDLLMLAPDSQLTVIGTQTSFAAADETIADGASLHAGDLFGPGVLSLPELAEYAPTGASSTNAIFEAFHAGSELDLSALQTITGTQRRLVIRSLNGGRIDLSNLSAVVRQDEPGAVSLVSVGPGSELDVSSLSDFTNTAVDMIEVETGATMRWGNPTALDGISLTIGGALETGTLSSFTSGRLHVTSGPQQVQNLDGITNANGSSLKAGSMTTGTLSLPNLTEYSVSGGPFTNSFFEALGAGSELNLSSLQTIHGGAEPFGNLRIEAVNGGHVDLSGLSSVVRRHDEASVTVLVERAGSEVDLSSMSDFTNGAIREIRAFDQAVVTLPSGQTKIAELQIELRNGRISAGEIILESGALISGGGSVAANVRNVGGEVVSGVTSTAPLVIEGSLVQAGGARTNVPAGTTLQVVGDAAFEEGAILSGAGTLQANVDLRGALGVDFAGALRVDGDFAISEAARLMISENYSLESGTESGLFTALEVTGSLTGQFSTVAGAGVSSHLGRGHFLTALELSPQSIQVSISATYPGDTDGDLDVDFPDFVQLANGFGKIGDWTNGDFDHSGEVDFPDFVTLANEFGKTFAPPAAAVPEPRTGVMLLGVLVLLATGRRTPFKNCEFPCVATLTK